MFSDQALKLTLTMKTSNTNGLSKNKSLLIRTKRLKSMKKTNSNSFKEKTFVRILKRYLTLSSIRKSLLRLKKVAISSCFRLSTV